MDLRVCPRFHVFYASLHDKVLTIIVNNEHRQAINIRLGLSCAYTRVYLCLFACVRVCVCACVCVHMCSTRVQGKHYFY